MTSNEDAETGYKALKRGSPTPLYYPLVRAAVAKAEQPVLEPGVERVLLSPAALQG